MKRLLTLIAVLAFAGVMLTGCGQQSDQTSPPAAPASTNAPAANP